MMEGGTSISQNAKVNKKKVQNEIKNVVTLYFSLRNCGFENSKRWTLLDFLAIVQGICHFFLFLFFCLSNVALNSLLHNLKLRKRKSNFTVP